MAFTRQVFIASQPRNRAMLRASPRRQQGVVLYVALIMLILLALIGVVGMQVTSLQEKMSSNYRVANLAFQNTEQVVKLSECGLDDIVKRTSTAGCSSPASIDSCLSDTVPFDAKSWSEQHLLAPKIRLIGPCIRSNASLSMGGGERRSQSRLPDHGLLHRSGRHRRCGDRRRPQTMSRRGIPVGGGVALGVLAPISSPAPSPEFHLAHPHRAAVAGLVAVIVDMREKDYA